MSAVAQKKPTPLEPNFANFPAELKSLPNWVLWRYLPPKSNGGKWRKVPFQPNGETASTTDRSTWNQFDTCCAAHAHGEFDGVGFVFDGEIGADGLCYCGVDFDACVRDGTNVDSLARSRIKRLNTYTEASVSGTGFHCIVRAEPLDRIVKHDGVEIYTNARFFTFTGRAFEKIKAAPTQVRALVDEVRAKEAAAKQQRQLGRSGSGGVSRTELTNPFNNAKPAQAFAALDLRDSLADGIKTTPWFEALPPQLKDEVVDYALGIIAKNTQLLELESNGGNNAEYYKLTVSVARSGAPNAEDIFVKHASSAKNADSNEALRQDFSRCSESQPSGNREITVGTLLRTARECGANFDQWKRQTTSAPDSTVNQGNDSEINPVAALMKLRDQGADIKTLLAAMNQAYAVVKYGSQIMLAIIIGGDISIMKVEDFHKMFANLVVHKETKHQDGATTTLTIKVSKRWFEWKDRRQYLGRGVVFEPGGPREIPNDMLNLWRGFGVEPKQGDWSLMRNHIRDVICSGNAEHFQYLIKWMAYGVQHPDRPIGVAIALRGEEGAGKGFLWRNYGKLFGKHFKHVAHGEHLTGRFNAALAEACIVFLDEAFWAGDRKGEQILKALVTEDTFQLERKFCDPIPVKNCLRIVIASNNQWIVPVSTRGRRYFVLDASDQYADENDPAHAAYWEPLQAQFGDYASDEGRAAMLYELLHMDLSGFNVRAAPQSAAKTEQKLLTQTGTEAWLFEILQDGAVTKSSHGSRHTISKWDANGMQVSRDDAYDAFLQSSQERREYKPRSKEWWSRDLREILKGCVSDERPRKDNPNRDRFLIFRPLKECRKAYGESVHADDIDWEPLDQPNTDTVGINSDADAHIDREHDETDADSDLGWEHDETEPEADIGWEHDETDPDPDIGREHDETDADAGIDWEPIDEPDTADESDADVVQVILGPV